LASIVDTLSDHPCETKANDAALAVLLKFGAVLSNPCEKQSLKVPHLEKNR